MKVLHLGFEHRADDVRIYHKECISMAEEGFDVTYITLTHENTVYENRKGLTVLELPYKPLHVSRLKKPVTYLKTVKKNRDKIFKEMLGAAESIAPDACHVHEYSLLPIGLAIKKSCKAKLVYDAHEDVPRQIENACVGKALAFRMLKRLQAFFTEWRENRFAKRCDLIVAATPHIQERFQKQNPNTICVCNYPFIADEDKLPTYNAGTKDVCYIGTIFKARGISHLVIAMDGLDARLLLGGKLSLEYKEELTKLNGWRNVAPLGFLGRAEVEDVMRRSAAGLFTPLPTGNIVHALPVKLFEYMYAGIPVIVSDFETYKSIVKKEMCGICVDPFDPAAIRNAIQFLLNHPDAAEQMGRRGHEAVVKRYRWDTQKGILISAYKALFALEESCAP